MENRILCIIPARSGSKGIIDKNIMDFKGKPLMAWSIEQAKQSKHSMRIVVSTDSEHYAEVARNYGAEVPFLRPHEISGDLSTDFECIEHAVTWMKTNAGYQPDIVLQLRPTQPCRRVSDIDDCLDIFIQNRHTYTALRTVIPVDKSPYKMYTMEGKLCKPIISRLDNMKEPYNQCRQILPQCYLHNGYVDIINVDNLSKNTLTGDKIYGYIMKEFDNVDIDYEEDIP